MSRIEKSEPEKVFLIYSFLFLLRVEVVVVVVIAAVHQCQQGGGRLGAGERS